MIYFVYKPGNLQCFIDIPAILNRKRQYLIKSVFIFTARAVKIQSKSHGGDASVLIKQFNMDYGIMIWISGCPKLSVKKNKHQQPPVLTQLCGRLHQAPGLTSTLADDQVQHVSLQAVLQHLMQGRAQVLQDEVTHVGTHPAVPQFSLQGLWGGGVKRTGNNNVSSIHIICQKKKKKIT